MSPFGAGSGETREGPTTSTLFHPHPGVNEMKDGPSVERRLFQWLFALSLLPALLVLVLAAVLLLGSLDWAGTLGPWTEVASSGARLIDRALMAAPTDSAVAEAARLHREQLSSSLTLARRWAFLGDRLATLLPVVVGALAALLALIAWRVSRRLSRQLARPVHELVDWTALIAQEKPLPEPGPRELREPREFRVLRRAFRQASVQLTEARRRALEAERVKVWGEMARRVAHEMKNALTPLRLAVHRLSRLDVDADGREPLVVMDEETGRLEELAARFASLGRPPAGTTSELDLRELLQSLLRTDVPAAVETRLNAEPVPLVEAYYEEVARTFRNLIRNAVEAMDGQETARSIEVDVCSTRIGAAAEHEAVEVRVADRGHGFEPGSLETIFQPDFTTKSRGTGLGLALARQTVLAHGGEIEARPREGGGAVFVVRLPVRPGRARSTGAA